MFKKIIDYALSGTIVAMLGIIIFMFVKTSIDRQKETEFMIHASSVQELLNENYVFINLGPAGLPDNQGYMVDYVENDTIYLIPNTEDAGY